MYQQMVTDTLSKATEKGIITRDHEAGGSQARSEAGEGRNGDGGRRSRWGDTAAERKDSPPAATGWGEADAKVSARWDSHFNRIFIDVCMC